MTFLVSPGVLVREFDITNIIPAVSTSIGAIAGDFQWGPVGERVLISNENQLVSRFGRPNATTAPYFYSAANFLSYANALWVVRMVDEDVALNSGTQGNTDDDIIIKNEDHYAILDLDAKDDFFAKYAGTKGNSYGISIAGEDSFCGWDFQEFFNDAPASGEVHVAIYDADGSTTGVAGSIIERHEFVSLTDGTFYADGSSNFIDNIVNQRSAYAWVGSGVVSADVNDTVEVTVSSGGDTITLPSGETIASTDVIGVCNATTGRTLTASEYTVYDETATSPNTPNTIVLTNAVTADTDFVVVRQYKLPFTGGVDGSPSTGDIITGYDLFADAEALDVNMLIGGPANEAIAEALIDICQTRKDCVAYLSPEMADVVGNPNGERDAVIEYRNTLPSTSYAFLDCGWKYQYDRYNDVYRWVPLNGDTAGLTARTDFLTDPWFSPAGFNRGQIKNVIKLSWNPNQADRDELYKKGVNPVIQSAGQGTILYGDKTLFARPSAFDRINVRRLFIILEKAIATAAKFQLFELNDEFTRANFRNMIEPYLRDIQGRRGILDFKVICDKSNNTDEVVNGNRFVADIYIQPAKSINYIELNFVAVGSAVEFDEVAGANRGLPVV